MTATSAIIPASGLGKRLGSESGKAFFEIAGRPLLAHTVQVFQDCPEITEIILVVRAEQVEATETFVRENQFTKVTAITAGGDLRQDSVRNGLAHVAKECDIVAIHDAARPLITPEIIAASIEAAACDGAAIVAVPVIDTIKSSLDGEFVNGTPNRENLFAVQTPQTFRKEIIEDAFDRAYADGFVGTDDASFVERIGLPVRIVRGSYENIKVTTPADIATVEAALLCRQGRESMERPTMPALRIGHGYDIHRFAPGRKLFLGGVEFPDEEGLLGHSDADVLLHAVSDALLGAAAAGDIGQHFPDTDQSFKDIRSTVLLERVAQVIAKLGWKIANVDVSLIAQRPRIAKHVPQMRENIANSLGISPEQVGVKATTAEGLGSIGEGQGIECHAVALLTKP